MDSSLLFGMMQGEVLLHERVCVCVSHGHNFHYLIENPADSLFQRKKNKHLQKI